MNFRHKLNLRKSFLKYFYRSFIVCSSIMSPSDTRGWQGQFEAGMISIQTSLLTTYKSENPVWEVKCVVPGKEASKGAFHDTTLLIRRFVVLL